MSGLFNSLAARSRGVSPGIQPRVPSLFEPLRQQSGVLGVRPDSREIGLDALPDNHAKVDGASREAVPMERLDLPSEPPQRSFSAAITEPRLAPADDRSFSLTTLRADALPDLPSASGESSRRAAGLRISEFVAPKATNRPIPHSSPDALRMAAESARGTPNRGPEAGSPIPSPAEIRPAHSFHSAPFAPGSSDAATTDSPAMADKSRTLAARLETSRLAGESPSPDRSPRSAPIQQPEEGRTRLSSPAPSGNQTVMPPDSFPRPSFRKEMGALSTGAIHPAIQERHANAKERPGPAPAVDETSEPSIRVTIGKVEVRAVFPSPPVNRTPAQRARPTLSLDEYLKRSSGAGR